MQFVYFNSQGFKIINCHMFPFRSVGKTQMNEQSSRSHFVFTLRISGVNEVQKSLQCQETSVLIC